jgi:hypothetical protein
MTRKRKHHLLCEGCGMRFPFTKKMDRRTVFDFGNPTRAPSKSCAKLGGKAICRWQVVNAWNANDAALQKLWRAGQHFAQLTLFVPPREIRIAEFCNVNAANEQVRARRLLRRLEKLLAPEDQRNLYGFGAVEPAVIVRRLRSGKVRRRVAMHLHIILWGVPLRAIRTAVKKLACRTEFVDKPYRVQHAYAPRGLLGYVQKALGDDRVSEKPVGATRRFKRKPKGRAERGVYTHWADFDCRDAELLIGLRRHGATIAKYRSAKPQAAIISHSSLKMAVNKQQKKSERWQGSAFRRQGLVHPRRH